VKGCYCFSSNVKHVLRLLALWSCGRRGSVVQAQRQIHRAHLGRPNRERSKASGQRGLNGQRDDISSSGSIVPSARAQPLPVVADAPDRIYQTRTCSDIARAPAAAARTTRKR
jgi:hypothetical protein